MDEGRKAVPPSNETTTGSHLCFLSCSDREIIRALLVESKAVTSPSLVIPKPYSVARSLKNHACQNDTTTTNARMICSCTVSDANNTPKGLPLHVKISLLLLLFTPMAVTRSYNHEHHQPVSRAGIQPNPSETNAEKYPPKSAPTLSMPSKRSFPNARP